jgi:glycosyltransferase involved in cell wall biosynthesis
MAYNKNKFTIFVFAYWHDPRFKRKVGGLIRIFDLANNLTRSGHSVLLFLPKIGYPKKQTISRVIEIPFIDLPLVRPLSFHLACTVIMLIKLIEGPDIFYVRKMNSLLPIFIAKFFKIRTFFEIPNDPYLAYKQNNNIKALLERMIDKYSIMLADKIVVLSEWSKRRLNQIGSIPISKLIVLPSGTDTVLFKPLPKEECCIKLGFDCSFFYVGFVGSFFFQQGVNTLIDSAPRILQKFRNTRFLLVGDGPMMEAYKQKVNREGLERAFIFTGHIPYRKVPEYIGVMDICVAPHLKDTNQASPVKIFDYMACGKPIVASDLEVVREIIERCGCTVLVSPEQPDELARAILSLIEGRQIREEMGEKGRNYAVDNFDRSKIVGDLIQKHYAHKEPSFYGE